MQREENIGWRRGRQNAEPYLAQASLVGIVVATGILDICGSMPFHAPCLSSRENRAVVGNYLQCPSEGWKKMLERPVAGESSSFSDAGEHGERLHSS